MGLCKKLSACTKVHTATSYTEYDVYRKVVSAHASVSITEVDITGTNFGLNVKDVRVYLFAANGINPTATVISVTAVFD